MARAVQVGALVVDQFPVFGPDGWTKVSGAGGFVVTVWRDGVQAVGVPVAIAEIGGSGEYRVTFTPPTAGLWAVEVAIPLNESRWFGEYAAELAPWNVEASMADDGTTARFTVWFEDARGRLGWVAAATARIMDEAGALVLNLGAGAGPSADGSFLFTAPAGAFAFHRPHVLVVTATDGAGRAWTGNAGFARVG